jgi:hypothetical protein
MLAVTGQPLSRDSQHVVSDLVTDMFLAQLSRSLCQPLCRFRSRTCIQQCHCVAVSAC